MHTIRLSTFVLGAVAVMTACIAKPAAAQLPVVGGPAAISVGAFLPTDTATQHRGGATQFDVEARYALPGIPFTGIKTIGTVGLETGARDGSHSTIVPVTLGLYAGSGGLNPLKAKNVYIGGGIGEYFINKSGISTTTRTGGFVAVGYNTPIALFAEAKYQFVDGGNGATVSVGLRF